VVGDPLCAMAGWLKFRSGLATSAYMTVGKFARYFLMTGSLIWAFQVFSALSWRLKRFGFALQKAFLQRQVAH
jgi:hypothetical protein